MLTAESQYSINFTKPVIEFCLTPHYNGSNSFLFLNTRKIFQLKVKDSEIKWIYSELNGYVYEFCVDYNIIDTSNFIDIQKYLMKKHDIK